MADLTAQITASTAFVVAITTAIITYVSQRKSAKEQIKSQLALAEQQRQTQNSLEELKQRISIEAENRTQRNARAEKRASLIAKEIELIQTGRDLLMRLIKAPRDMYRIDQIQEQLLKLHEQIEKQYAEHLSVAKELSIHVNFFHRAKKTIFAVCKRLEAISDTVNDAAEIDTGTQEEITRARRELRNCQEQVRDQQLMMIANEQNKS